MARRIARCRIDEDLGEPIVVSRRPTWTMVWAAVVTLVDLQAPNATAHGVTVPSLGSPPYTVSDNRAERRCDSKTQSATRFAIGGAPRTQHPQAALTYTTDRTGGVQDRCLQCRSRVGPLDTHRGCPTHRSGEGAPRDVLSPGCLDGHPLPLHRGSGHGRDHHAASIV
jgi:hypothetical protein